MANPVPVRWDGGDGGCDPSRISWIQRRPGQLMDLIFTYFHHFSGVFFGFLWRYLWVPKITGETLPKNPWPQAAWVQPQWLHPVVKGTWPREPEGKWAEDQQKSRGIGDGRDGFILQTDQKNGRSTWFNPGLKLFHQRTLYKLWGCWAPHRHSWPIPELMSKPCLNSTRKRLGNSAWWFHHCKKYES